MIQYRNGIFETNSSSCHSLIIRRDKTWFNNPKHCIDNASYTITGDYYGRTPQLPIEDTEAKLNYIWTMVNGLWGLCFANYKDKEGNWLKEEDRQVKYQNESRFMKWRRMLQDIFPNATFVTVAANNYDVGIDHVYDLEPLADFIEENPDLLYSFLLDYSWIDISGDEYAHWPGILPYPWDTPVEINKSTYLYVKGN